jgi:hypothetical protein
MTTTRTLLALALTLPLYLGSCIFPRHRFSEEWEDAVRSLFGR